MFFSQLSRLQPRANVAEQITGPEQLLKLLQSGSQAWSGISVTPDSALRCAAVYGCDKVIREDVAKLPLILYRRQGKGKERATDHYLYRRMHDRPNPGQTSANFRALLQSQYNMRGNAYAFINRVGGQVRELLPLPPDRVRVKQEEDWSVTYEVRERAGSWRTFQPEQIFHLVGLHSLDGVTGCSPITYARETIGLAMAAEKHGAKIFANGAKMGGVLEMPGIFKDREVKRQREHEFDELTSGENVNRTVILEQGTKWIKATMTSEDAQYLESRQFSVPEICRFWRVPPHKIMDLLRATYNNIEHQALEYVSDCLMPVLVCWEQTLNFRLLTEREQEEGYFFEFLLDALLRADTKTRAEAEQLWIQNGIFSVNEIRARENANPRENGDTYLRMAQTVPWDTPAAAAALPAPSGGKQNAQAQSTT